MIHLGRLWLYSQTLDEAKNKDRDKHSCLLL